MAALWVTDRSGRAWRVGRAWLLWHNDVREAWRAHDGASDEPWDGGGLIGWAFLAAIGVLFLVAGPVLGLIPLIWQVLILLAAVPFALWLRIAVGGPWVLVARTEGEVHSVRVEGWKTSGEWIDHTVAAIAEKGAPPSPPWARVA